MLPVIGDLCVPVTAGSSLSRATTSSATSGMARNISARTRRRPGKCDTSRRRSLTRPVGHAARPRFSMPTTWGGISSSIGVASRSWS